jgi:hypothetical protein
MVIVDEAGLIRLVKAQGRFVAPAGSILALYTDGLAETRGSGLDLQIEKAGAERQGCSRHRRRPGRLVHPHRVTVSHLALMVAVWPHGGTAT